MKLLEIALSQVGEHEVPDGSNKTKYGEWYGLNAVPWCAIFVSWCFDRAGIPLGRIDSNKGYHYCPSAFNHFKKKGMVVSDSPKEGDIVFFDWNHDLRFDHTGIFLRDIGNGLFESVEGNTSIGNDSNGGEVMIRKRYYSTAKFVRTNKNQIS